MKEIFEQAQRVVCKLINHGYEAYIVGGAVRNWFLNLPIRDIDIATSAKPEEVMALFPVTFPIGIEHGTVLVHYEHVDYEVTTFRTEADYSDFRHPQHVAFIGSITEDLARRDFTINAMARDKFGVIIDPFNGRKDLKERLLRTVGQAEKRFTEDPLRMLRAARFISQLNVMATPDVLDAMAKQKHLLNWVAIERVLQEMSKLLEGQCPRLGLELLIKTNVLCELPMLSEISDLQIAELLAVDFNRCTSLVERWVAFLLVLNRESLDVFLESWRFSNHLKNQIFRLAHNYLCFKEVEWTKWQLYDVGLQQALAIQRLRSAKNKEDVECMMHDLKAMNQELSIHSRTELASDGHDLQAWLGRSPGPWIKEMLVGIERAVVENRLSNDKDAIKRWVMACHRRK